MIERYTQYRINWKVLGLRVGLSLATILVVAALTGAFQKPKVLLTIVGMVMLFSVIGVGFRQFTRLVEPTIWPARVRRLDDRSQPVVVGEVGLKEIPLDSTEQLMLAAWVSTRKQPLLSRASTSIAMWVIFLGGWLAWIRVGSVWIGRDAALYGGLAVMFALGYLVSRMQRVAVLRLNSDGLLFAGRCAVCGYDLKPRMREPDGCTICAECGAAWKMSERMQFRRERAMR